MNRSPKLRIECLEARDNPAPLSFAFDGLGNLQITGIPDNANGGLAVLVPAPNLVDVIDGGELASR